VTLSSAETTHPTSSAHSFLLIPILILFALLVVAVLRSPNLISSSGIGSAVIVAAPLILATYALTIIVMAGRGGVDLSIGPLIGFINVTLVQLFGAGILTTPVEFFVYAFAVGVAYQLLMGLIIVFVRIQPIIVALSGYLTLAGLNLMILPRPGGLAPAWMSPWGLGESIWSPVLAILIIATGAWFLFTRTAFYDHLRLMGSDERTAYTAGVNITIVRLGAHVIAGLYAALAALTFTSLISSGDPTQGSTYTLMTVTALVLGGTSLAGGRGSIIGSLLGALNIYLITYVLATFSFGKIQSFVTQLAYGLILVAALLLTIFLPQIRRYTRAISPIAVFVFLGLVSVGVVLYAKDSVRVARVAQSAATSVGQSLSAGTSLSGQSLSGQSLSGQSLSGQSLSGQSLSAGTSLSGTSLSGTSLSAGAEAETGPTGTPVVVAAVIIAAIVFLIYMLYRHLNLATLVFVGVVVLLVIGYAAYQGGAPPDAAQMAATAGQSSPGPFFMYLEGPYQPGQAVTGSLLSSPWISGAAFLVGAILLGTVLIFMTVPQVDARIGETALWFMAIVGAGLALFLVYESTISIGGSAGAFPGGIAALVVGAVLFVATLPAFQRRIRNVSLIMITLLSIATLAAAFFAIVPEGGLSGGGAVIATPAAPAAVSDAPLSVALPSLFYLEVFWVLIAATILFLLMIPGVRRHVMTNIRFDPGSQGFSYTGIFIAVTATVAMGAVFVATGIPIWKYIVVMIAGVIGARFFFHFLSDYRRKYGSNPRHMKLDGPAGTGGEVR